MFLSSIVDELLSTESVDYPFIGSPIEQYVTIKQCCGHEAVECKREGLTDIYCTGFVGPQGHITHTEVMNHSAPTSRTISQQTQYVAQLLVSAIRFRLHYHELWFQQDGATCHTARATIDLLKDTFGDRLISRFGPVNRPPRSCDLTPLDYFLWGYVKSLVYADKPQTLDHLEDNIRRVIADIRPQMLEKVIEDWTSRLDNIRASRGSPMAEIIFKM
ncbi:putative LOC100569746 [Trichonephila clavipes]|nr:putative LOC100569746 [Trichonephila clavipes]